MLGRLLHAIPLEVDAQIRLTDPPVTARLLDLLRSLEPAGNPKSPNPAHQAAMC